MASGFKNPAGNLDEKIESIQRSTRTLLPFMIRPHNWLRMRFKLYYRWHIFPFANLIHICVLIAYLLSTGLYAIYQSPLYTRASTNLSQTSQADFQAGTVDDNLDLTSSPGDITLKQSNLYNQSVSYAIKKSHILTNTTTPALPTTDTRQICANADYTVLYVPTGAGLAVINTDGSTDYRNYSLTGTYTNSSVPALASSSTDWCKYDDGRHLLIVKEGAVYQVIDTQDTSNISDDTVYTVYTAPNGSAAAYYDLATGYLIAASQNTNPNIHILDLKGTANSADDVMLRELLVSNNFWIYNFALDNTHHRFYVAHGDGVAVYDTVDGNPANYTYLGKYDHTWNLAYAPRWNESNNWYGIRDTANALGIDETNHLLYVTHVNWDGDNGVSVIKTNFTGSIADDTLVTNYSGICYGDGRWQYGPVIPDPTHNRVISGESNALRIIDTKGTVNDTTDDTLLAAYTTYSDPPISSDAITGAVYDSTRDILYTSGGGLTILPLSQSQYIDVSSSRQSSIDLAALGSSPGVFSWNQTKSASQTISTSTQLGTNATSWQDAFSTDSTASYAGDAYSWGRAFGTATASNGTIKLSNPSPYLSGAMSMLDFWFDPGQGEPFPIGSVFRARVRINSQTRQAYFTHDLKVILNNTTLSATKFSPINNEWYDVSYTSTIAFSKVGFRFAYFTGTWDASDTFEVDWIKVETPITWTEWSAACNGLNSGCNLGDTSGKTYLQYKYDLSTTDLDTSPTVSSIVLTSGYPASGTFDSSVMDAGSEVSWTSLVAESTIPNGGSISYSVRSGNTATPDSSWTDWQTTTGSLSNLIGRYAQYRAVLAASDKTKTPTISSISLVYSRPGSVEETPTISTTEVATDPIENIPDTTPPVFALTKVGGGKISESTNNFSYYTSRSSALPVFEGTGEIGATVTVKTVEPLEQVLCSAIVDDTENWNCKSGVGLVLGQHKISVSASDSSGNVVTRPSFDLMVVKEEVAVTPAPSTLQPVQDVSPSTNPAPNLSDQAKKAELVEYAKETIKSTGFIKTNITKVEDKSNKEKSGQYVLSVFAIIIKDPKGNPITNQAVTLHSDPQTAVTDNQGVAVFTDVLLGDHTLEYTSKNNQKIEAKLAINLPADKIEAAATSNQPIELTPLEVTINVKHIIPWWYGVVGIVILVLLFVLIIILFKRRNSKNQKIGFDTGSAPMINEGYNA